MKISVLLTGLVMAIATMIVARPVKAVNQVDVPIVPGYNFVSLPVVQRVTFQDLCRQYPFESIGEYVGHEGNNWKEYNCNTIEKSNKKIMQERVGYMLRSNTTFTLHFEGSPITNYSYTHVAPTWTSIGVPMATQYNLTAHNLCGPLSNTNVDITEVSAWVNGVWSTHYCSAPLMNNYPLRDWEGYLVKSVLR